MTNYLIIPGLGNSDENHWQSLFEKSNSNFKRIIQADWDTPKCVDWTKEINEQISKYESNSVVLIGHSLGCATIAHWSENYDLKIKGALLVAPSDLEAPVYTFPAVGFNPMPKNKLNFKTIVVTSSDDKWVSLERAEFFAKNWGSKLINIGKAGHINSESGFGEWNEGLEILKQFE